MTEKFICFIVGLVFGFIGGMLLGFYFRLKDLQQKIKRASNLMEKFND